MTAHRAPRRRLGWLGALRERRVRALLCVGCVLGLGGVSTLASWSDTAAIPTGSFASGTLDLMVDGNLAGPGGSYTKSALSMANMVPGESVSVTLIVQSATGSLPLDYYATATSTGELSPGLLWTVVPGATANAPTGSQATGDRSGTCSAGTATVTDQVLTGTPTAGDRHQHRRRSPRHRRRRQRERLSPGPARPRRRQRPADQVRHRDVHPQRLADGRPVTEPARWRHRAVETVLTLGAVLGVLCATWAVCAVAFGLTPLVLVSGSMSPAIEVGDLAVARSVPADRVAEGDVVSVRSPDGVRVTHRVVETRSLGGSTSLVLRGDANAAPDATPYEVETVDRVLFHVPHAGRALAAASSRAGTLLVTGLVAGLLLLGFGGSQPRRPPGGRRRAAPARAAAPRRRVPGGGLLLGAVVVGTAVTGASVVPGPTPTTAAFTDVGGVTAAPSAYTLPKPALTCAKVGSDLRFSWPVSSAPVVVGYAAEVVNGPTLPVQGSGATRYVEVSPSLLSTVLGSTRTVSVVSQTPVASSWSSVAGRHNFTIVLVGISVSCSGSGY